MVLLLWLLVVSWSSPAACGGTREDELRVKEEGALQKNVHLHLDKGGYFLPVRENAPSIESISRVIDNVMCPKVRGHAFMPPSRQNEATSVFSVLFIFLHATHDNDDNTEYHARACQSKRDAGNQSAAYYFRISDFFCAS